MSRPERGTRGTRGKRPGWDEQAASTGDATGPGGFLCSHCGLLVPETAPGTGQRNHCPHCLWSLHVDIKPGDRASLCRGDMEPVALWASAGNELRIVHRCSKCGVLKPNRVAGDDSDDAIRALHRHVSHALNSQIDGTSGTLDAEERGE